MKTNQQLAYMCGQATSNPETAELAAAIAKVVSEFGISHTALVLSSQDVLQVYGVVCC